MDTCNITPESREIQSQFIESVPGFSEFGSGMVAAISHMAHEELDCLREFIQKKGDIHTTIKSHIGITRNEFEQFREYILRLEEAIIDTINPETKKDGYIAFDLTEKNRQGLGEYAEYISLLYRARNVYGIGNTPENIQYLKLPEWNGSRQIRIIIGNEGKKFFIKNIQILPVDPVESPENGDTTPKDYETADGKYFG